MITGQHNQPARSNTEGIAGQRTQIEDLSGRTWTLCRTDVKRAAAALRDLREALDALPAPYQSGEAGLMVIQAWQEMERGAFLPGLELSFEARRLLSPAEESRALFVIGEIFAALGEPYHALQYHQQAFYRAQEQSVPAVQAAALGGMGSAYRQLGNPTQAHDLYNKALTLAEKIENAQLVTDLLLGLAFAHAAVNNLPGGLNAAQEALNRYAQLEAPVGQCRALLALSDFGAFDDLPHAITLARQAVGLALDQDHGPLIIQARRVLGNLLARSDEPANAIQQLEAAVQLAATRGIAHLSAHAHQELAELYQNAGEPAACAHHLQASLQARDDRQTLQRRAVALTLNASTGGSPAEQLAHYRRRNQALVREVEEKQRVIMDLDTFSRSVAHDLKSPLSIITGYGELVMNEIVTLKDANLVRRMEQILEAAFKTNRIIDELLILAGVSKQRVTLQPLDMPSIISEVETRIVRVMSDRQIEIRKPQQWPTALGHAPWIEQVWANYISNAIKYGGNPPRLEVGATPLADGFVRFWVRDNGEGINAEAQAQLFQAFERLGNTRVTGHGLGLSIVKNIVEKLGGEVGIDSQPGHGSTFSFTLPTENGKNQVGRPPSI